MAVPLVQQQIPQPLSRTYRIDDLPPYPLGQIANEILEARKGGADVIDLGQINPDLGPPPQALDKLVQSILRSHNHRYSSSKGILALRKEAAKYYSRAFGVEIDPEEELLVTLGTKEGLSHLLLSILNPGETVIVPTPCYPLHRSSVFIAGGNCVELPLLEEQTGVEVRSPILTSASEGFFKRLSRLYAGSSPLPRAIILGFPHNPTATVVDRTFIERIVDFALKHDLLIINDFAYGELVYDDCPKNSFLSVPGAKECVVEFYSMSKAFNLAGWRVGFCAGNRRAIAALRRIKSHLDFGVFQPLQIAATEVLRNAESVLEETRGIYRNRRDVLVEELRKIGFDVALPRAALFVWTKIPDRFRSHESSGSGRSSSRTTSLEFASLLLREAQVAVSPGVGFDSRADDYLRFAFIDHERRLRLACRNIGKVFGNSA